MMSMAPMEAMEYEMEYEDDFESSASSSVHNEDGDITEITSSTRKSPVSKAQSTHKSSAKENLKRHNKSTNVKMKKGKKNEKPQPKTTTPSLTRKQSKTVADIPKKSSRPKSSKYRTRGAAPETSYGMMDQAASDESEAPECIPLTDSDKVKEKQTDGGKEEVGIPSEPMTELPAQQPTNERVKSGKQRKHKHRERLHHLDEKGRNKSTKDGELWQNEPEVHIEEGQVDQERPLQRDGERQQTDESNLHKSHRKDSQTEDKPVPRERKKEKLRAAKKVKKEEMEKEKKDLLHQNDKDGDKDSGKPSDKDGDKDHDKHHDKVGDKDHDKPSVKDGDKDPDKPSDKDGDKDPDKPSDKDEDRHKRREKHRNRYKFSGEDRDRDQDKHGGSDKHIGDKHRERDIHQDRDKHCDGEKHRYDDKLRDEHRTGDEVGDNYGKENDDGGVLNSRSKHKKKGRHEDEREVDVESQTTNETEEAKQLISDDKGTSDELNRHKNSGEPTEELLDVKDRAAADDIEESRIRERSRRRKKKHKRRKHDERQFDDGDSKQEKETQMSAGQQERNTKPRKSWRDISLVDVIKMDRQRPYTWDLHHKGMNIYIHNQAANVLHREVASQSTDAARGCRGYTIGYHEFKFSFNDKPWGTHCAVGFCTKDAVMHAEGYVNLIGADSHSWGWDIPTCTLYHGGKACGRFPRNLSPEEIPRTFSMILDLYNGILSFDFNHEDVEEAFTDIPPLSEELFPAVSLVYGLSEVTIQKVVVASPQANLVSPPQPPISERLPDPHSSQHASHSAKPTDHTPSSPRPKLKDLGATFKSYHERQKEEEMEVKEEAADAVYVKMEELSQDDREMMQQLHGWDFVNRGGLVTPYPNIPRICVPQLAIANKVQGIRGKRGFRRNQGRHLWLIRELRLYSPLLSQRETNKKTTPYTTNIDYQGNSNAVIFGVASSEHRTFNYGFELTQMGDHAWGFEPSSKLAWHGCYFTSPEDMPGSKGSLASPEVYRISGEKVEKEIDMTEGVLVELDTHKHTLTYRHGDELLCVQQRVHGDILYPFLLFNQEVCFPVEIRYLQGPLSYVEGVLHELHAMTGRQRDDVVNNYRCLVKRSASSQSHSQQSGGNKQSFQWGTHSPEVTISFMHKNVLEVSSKSPGAAVSLSSLSKSRHAVEFTIDGTTSDLAIGLVGPSFSATVVTHEYNKHTTPYALGSNIHSWCWDVHGNRIYHAGLDVGRFPVRSGVDLSDYSKFCMTLDFTHLGYNTASFTAIPADSKHKPVELGVAFVNLPESLQPAVVVSADSREKVSVCMDYVLGSWSSEKESLRRAQGSQASQGSQACTLL